MRAASPAGSSASAGGYTPCDERLLSTSAPTSQLEWATIQRPRLLVDKQHKSVDRFTTRLAKAKLYWQDLFHTLLNMPRWRFIAVFFAVFVTSYFVFALLYLLQPEECIPGIEHISTAMWFSVQTAASIGYGSFGLAPNPACAGINLLVMLQVICSQLVSYAMMGILFARFSAPSKRALSLRLSTCAVLHPHASGFWCLCLRMANLRKHLLIKPEVQLLLAKPDNPGQSAFVLQELALEDLNCSLVNLRLGMTATLTHVIRPGSPLWRMSIDDLLLQEQEIMCCLEAVDYMTSNFVQARRSYYAGDCVLNARFATVYLLNKGERLGLDLSTFDETVALGTSDQAAMLRRQRFCDLTAASSAQRSLAGSPAPPAGWQQPPSASQQQQPHANGQVQQRQQLPPRSLSPLPAALDTELLPFPAGASIELQQHLP